MPPPSTGHGFSCTATKFVSQNIAKGKRPGRIMANFLTVIPLLCGGLLIGLLLLIEAGRRLGVRRLATDPEGARAGAGTVEGAVFALLGLLIAFTFSGAASRFDDRRHLVAEEANAIGTAWLRIDVLPASAQPPLRHLFRQYLDSRLATYRQAGDADAVRAESVRSRRLQQEIWTLAVNAARDSGSAPAQILLLPALNAMIDITTTRAMAAQIHPPAIIFIMLAVLALAGAMFIGYGMAGARTRSWFHSIGFATVIAAAVYVIVDIEYPRHGLIRVDAADQVLVELRRAMN
jgi:hypothetical protein